MMIIEAFGEKKTVAEWSKESGVRVCTIKARIRDLGWAPEKAVSYPVDAAKWGWGCIVEFKGRSMTLKEWAMEKGCSPHALRARLEKGWSIEDVVTIPVRPRATRKRSDE